MKFKNKIALILASAAMALPLAFGGLGETQAHATAPSAALYYTSGKHYGAYYAWYPITSMKPKYVFGKFPSSLSRKGTPLWLYRGYDPFNYFGSNKRNRYYNQKYNTDWPYEKPLHRHGHTYYNGMISTKAKIGRKTIGLEYIYIDSRDIGKRVSNKDQFNTKIQNRADDAQSNVRYVPFKRSKPVRKHYRRSRIHRKRVRRRNVKRNRAKRTAKRQGRTRRK